VLGELLFRGFFIWEDGMEVKTCSKCRVEKSVEEFGKNKRCTDGYQFSCRLCTSDAKKEYYAKNKERVLNDTKRWYEKNKEKRAISKKNYRQANKDAVAKQRKEYCAANRVKRNEWNKAWLKTRKLEDPLFKLKHILLPFKKL
jgi:hypothetical protein